MRQASRLFSTRASNVISRCSCGSFSNQYKYKSDLVKKELELKFLYADIDSMDFLDRSVQAFIQEPPRLAHYDLIISALGEPILNLEINKILASYNIDTPFLCCFNEPYGIGGHVIISNIDKHSYNYRYYRTSTRRSPIKIYVYKTWKRASRYHGYALGKLTLYKNLFRRMAYT